MDFCPGTLRGDADRLFLSLGKKGCIQAPEASGQSVWNEGSNSAATERIREVSFQLRSERRDDR